MQNGMVMGSHRPWWPVGSSPIVPSWICCLEEEWANETVHKPINSNTVAAAKSGRHDIVSDATGTRLARNSQGNADDDDDDDDGRTVDTGGREPIDGVHFARRPGGGRR